MGDEKTIDPASFAGLSRDEIIERLSAAGVSVSSKSAEDRLHELEIEVAELRGSQLPIEKNSPLDWASDEYWKGSARAMAHSWPILILVVCMFIFVFSTFGW